MYCLLIVNYYENHTNQIRHQIQFRVYLNLLGHPSVTKI